MPDHEIFMPYDRLVTIDICGRSYQVPENNTILRCLQYLDMDGVSDAELCWNGDCLNCQVTVKTGKAHKRLIACRADVADGMEICELSDELMAATAIGDRGGSR